MSANPIVVTGTIGSDGNLDLDRKLNLAPGPVQLVVQSIPELPQKDSFWQTMQGIWDGQLARGHIPRTKEEIDAEINELRDDDKGIAQ